MRTDGLRASKLEHAVERINGDGSFHHTTPACLRAERIPRYPKAVECVRKDQRTLLAFFDWPAVHWIHLRTTNPIESVFATVRHRTVRTKGSLSPTPPG